jgi:anti-anti-sigma factor
MPAVVPMASTERSNELTVSLEERDGSLVIHVVGQVGIPTEADQLERALARAYLHRPRVIAVDLSQTSAISSQGLSALLKWRQLIRTRIAPIRLARPQPNVLDMMQRSGMVELFEIYPTIEAALVA